MKHQGISTDLVWVAVLVDPNPSMYSHDTCQPQEIFLKRDQAEAYCKLMNSDRKYDWQSDFRWQVFSLADRMHTIMSAPYESAQYSDVS
jgi:hypothetical protein